MEAVMGLARLLAILLVVAGLALATACALATVRRAPLGPVYAVAAVHAGLVHASDRWVGRTVRVRGIAVLCLSADIQSYPQRCGRWPMYLVNGDAGAATGVLPLALGQQDGEPALLRRVLQFAGIVPASQVVRWGAVATYQVRLRAAPASSCASPPCYQAVLLDAAP
jgi:hypothetical protein